MTHDHSDRWLTQSRISAPELGIQGNCTQAAVASLFGLDLCDVPDFNTGDALAWHKGMEVFFASRGYELLRFDNHRHFRGLYLAGGPSRRGVQHMIVMRNGETVHDPYPGGFGLTKIEHVWVPVPLDPATRLVSMPAALDSLSRKATAGPWVSKRREADSYDSFEMRSLGYCNHEVAIFDTLNSEAASREEDHDEGRTTMWDERGRADLEYVAALVNWHRGVLEARDAET